MPSRTKPLVDDLTHFVRWDEPGTRVSKALCGIWIHRKDHHSAPTCPTCARLLAEFEASAGPA